MNITTKKRLFSEIRARNETDTTLIEGTADADILYLLETTGHVTAHMRAGDDTVELYGLADYRVDLGNGADTLLIDTVGDVTALGGKGDDVFEVEEMGAHHLKGQGGVDLVSFASLGDRVIADMVEGEVRSGSETMKITSIENLRGSAFGDVVRGNDGANVIEGLD
ncbi:MAG: hypothetical protein AAF968_22260, partial [Pseudomonadota bacterium]